MIQLDTATALISPARTAANRTTPHAARLTPTWPQTGGDTIALTPAGRASLEQELRRLRNDRLPALVAQLADARDDPATRTEGADLLAVRQEQHRGQRRAADLAWLLTVARPVEPPVNGVIALGSTVEIEDDGERDLFQLVDPREANVTEGRISTVSPVGRALLGQRAGDEVGVEGPSGQRSVRIVAVS